MVNVQHMLWDVRGVGFARARSITSTPSGQMGTRGPLVNDRVRPFLTATLLRSMPFLPFFSFSGGVWLKGVVDN